MLNDARYIQELRKNLISLGILLVNGFSYNSDEDRDIMMVKKDALTMLRSKRTTSNINKLLGKTITGDVVLLKSDNDATKLGTWIWVI